VTRLAYEWRNTTTPAYVEEIRTNRIGVSSRIPGTDVL